MTKKQRGTTLEQHPPFTTLYQDHDEVFVRGTWRRIGAHLLNGTIQLGTRNNLPVRRRPAPQTNP